LLTLNKQNSADRAQGLRYFTYFRPLFYKISSKTSKKDLRLEEKRLLNLYLNEHLETPPLNMGLS
jgi:hypothetical protein